MEVYVRGSAADLENSFYQLSAPEVASWFAIRHKVRAYDWGCRQIWDGVVQGYADLGPEEVVFYPVF